MPMVFPLEHRRASYVADQVMQQSGQSRASMGDQTVYIAVNRRQNSLLVNTPPEKAPLIERDWYAISAWHLDATGCCASCGAQQAGRFHTAPGEWGNRRQRLRLAE